MSNLERTRFCTLVGLVLALALGGLPRPGFADEPVADDFPPPKKATPATATPPAVKPPAVKPPADDPAPATEAASAGWSQPAVTSGAGSPLGSLPPPRVVRRGAGSAPRAAPQPAAARPIAAQPMASAPRFVVVRPRGAGSAPASRPPPPPPPPFDASIGTRPSGPALRAAAPSAPARGTGSSRIYSVAKTHNVQLQDGEMTLRLDVDYELQGQAGSDVYVAIWFARADGGALVRSALAGYADTSGNATVQTRAARVAGASARFNAVLQVPYRAFPVANGTDAYDVEARVQILRKEGEERVTILARSSTIFRVYGAPNAAK